MDALVPRGRGRGAELLLVHVAALATPDHCRPSPLERLEAAVGGDLAHTLVRALSGEHGTRPLPLG
jgi:hypothetical protein